MSHPKNKHDRNRYGKLKSKKRVENKIVGTEHLRHHMLRHEDTTTQCSCAMCGNPRKYFNEKTMQEKRFDESSKENDDA